MSVGGRRRFPSLQRESDSLLHNTEEKPVSDDCLWTGKLETRPLWRWSEVEEGSMVYLKYWWFRHAVLVTEVLPRQNSIRGIHYAVGSTVFHKRIVKEQTFIVNLINRELWVVNIPETVRRPKEESIRTGRDLIGEKKFSMLYRRSSHLVLKCILKEKWGAKSMN